MPQRAVAALAVVIIKHGSRIWARLLKRSPWMHSTLRLWKKLSAQLDVMAYELNIQPHKRFGLKRPIEVMTERMAKHHEAPALLQ